MPTQIRFSGPEDVAEELTGQLRQAGHEPVSTRRRHLGAVVFDIQINGTLEDALPLVEPFRAIPGTRISMTEDSEPAPGGA